MTHIQMIRIANLLATGEVIELTPDGLRLRVSRFNMRTAGTMQSVRLLSHAALWAAVDPVGMVEIELNRMRGELA